MDRVLIIDDDDRLAEMLVAYLTDRGLSVQREANATSGAVALRQGGFDAVILDVMLPDGDGFEVLRTVRALPDPARAQVPIVMLTARGDELDRIVGLEMGADDYLPKPFNPRELLARIKAVLRRRGTPSGSPMLRFGRLEVDPGAREARIDGELRPMTSHQFSLLLALARRAGQVLSREQLMQAVRGESLELYDRSIDVHMSRIRAAIEDDPKRPTRIVTVRGIGYVFSTRQDQGA